MAFWVGLGGHTRTCMCDVVDVFIDWVCGYLQDLLNCPFQNSSKSYYVVILSLVYTYKPCMGLSAIEDLFSCFQNHVFWLSVA